MLRNSRQTFGQPKHDGRREAAIVRIPSEFAEAVSRAQRGWRVVAVRSGDGFGISATWEIQRSTNEPTLLIDFDGLEPMGWFCFPLEKSYGCSVRGHKDGSLYFCKKIVARREHWIADMKSFLKALEKITAE